MGDFRRFASELLAGWWGRVFLLLGAGSTAATYAASFYPGFVVPRWVPLVISLIAWFLAPYELYRRKLRTIAELDLRIGDLKKPRSELVVYPGKGNRFFVEVRSGKAFAVYIELVLTIENKGDRNSNVMEFVLDVAELGGAPGKTAPAKHNYVQTASANHATRTDWMGDAFNVPQHNMIQGNLPFYVPCQLGDDVKDLHTTLTIRDSEGMVARQEFDVKRVG